MGFLDNAGVSRLWAKAKSYFAAKSHSHAEYIKGISVSGKTITYTKGDGTTGTQTTQDTVYTHPTSAGNKHIPTGGSSGQILRWSAAGTAAWGADNNTTYSAMTGATSAASGKSGLVPAPAAGTANRYLRSDGTWQVPSTGSATDYRPKDSVYLTKGSESPASLFGGSWTKRTDTHLFMGYKVWERVG